MIDNEVLSSFEGKNVLVTGGTGMIGRQVVGLLLQAGANIRTVSLEDKLDDKSEHVKADLTHLSSCEEALDGIELVFHLAAVKASVKATIEKPASCFVPTVLLNTNFLEACRKCSIEKLVYTSSIGAYASADFLQEDKNLDQPPMDKFPGMAKRIAELQINSYRIEYGIKDFSIVRLANVYGPGDRFGSEFGMVVPSLISRIHEKQDPLVVWGDGSAIRDFVYSSDVAEGILLAMYHGTGDGFVNLGSGIGYSIKELLEALHGFLDFKHEFNNNLGGHPKRVLDISLARKTINYNPTTSLQDGLKRTWEWYVENHNEHKHDYFQGTE